MGKIELTYAEYAPFGRCAKLTNGIVEMYVTVETGPRVIHFSLVGKENVFFNDVEKTTLGDKFDVYGGRHLRLLGGHRIWISPEIMPRCYHPDDLPVTVEEDDYGADFIAAVEEHNHIRKIMRVRLGEDDGGVTIEHVIKNVGLWDIELAPWCITMLAPGGVEVMPQPKDDEGGLLPNRNLVLWPYSDMSDERVHWGKDFITLKQDSSKKNPFKLGYNNKSGWAAYFNRGQAFIKFFDMDDEDIYPDGGCNFESYTNAAMLESESLGAMSILPPDDEILHIEEWELHAETEEVPADESAIAEFLSKHIEF